MPSADTPQGRPATTVEVPDRLLDDAKRMVLAWAADPHPLLAPMAFWSDGRHLWASTSGSSGKVRAFERDPACTAWVPGGAGRPGLSVTGHVRVFRPTDVVAMATHGPTLAAAQTALSVKNYASVAGYAVDAARVPSRWLPQSRVMLRITMTQRQPVSPPALGPGIAPALPTEVPADIRRVLSGQRQVTVGWTGPTGVGLAPAVWGPGMTLDLPDGMAPPSGAAVNVVADHDPGFRPTEVAGLSLRGTWDGRAVVAVKVRWWHGFDQGGAPVEPRTTDPVVIPD